MHQRPRPEVHTIPVHRVREAASKDKVHFARDQRKAPTGGEEPLWQALRARALGVRFRRQHPVADFVLDFYCEAAHLAVEIDGPGHDRQSTYDGYRDQTLQRAGIRTLRLSPAQVERDLAGTLALIRQELSRSAESNVRS